MLLQPFKLTAPLLSTLLVLVTVSTGCLTIKDAPKYTPFIYKTSINIQGNAGAEEKAVLQEQLQSQLDDSLRLRTRNNLPFIKKMEKPPLFDTIYASRTVQFMSSALYQMGYYKATIQWDSSLALHKKGDQQRVTVKFTVVPGKSFKFDSIAYHFDNSELQSIAMNNRGVLLKKGAPYSTDIITAEIERLLSLFRNQGYYRISKEDIRAERDTVFAALLNPELDPFERIQLLEEARRRRTNPTMNIIFKLRDNANPKNLRKYVIKNIRVYPDLDLLFDNNKPLRFDSVAISGIRIFNLYKKFKPAFVASQIALKPGQLYRLSNYIRTYGNFSQLGAWSQVNISFLETRDSAATLDVDIRLYPAKKQDLSITLDGSYNTGNVFSAGIGGNLFGIGINFGLNNRNVARQAIQSSTNLRAGVELGIRNDQVGNFIQTIQANLSHTIIFPGLVLPNFIKRPSKSDSLRSQRTQLNFNASYADRRDYFLLRSLNVSWGYEWRIKKHAWYYSPFNVEFVDLQKRRLLDTLIKNLPSLQYAFNNGLIISQLVGYNYQNQYGRKRHLLRVGLEESGLIFGTFRRLDTEANLSRFVKLDVDYRHTINYRKTALVFRFYTGLGIPYGKRTRDTLEFQLPFFKSFVAGGPYSMRGWQIRRLGAGSAPKFYTGDTRLSDRFGDVQIEGNVEYRFDIGTVLGFKIKSALFTDIGNIWYRNNQNNPDLNNAVFRFSTAFRDLAIASGTSLRLDFSYFLIRLDWAYRIKDPAFANKNNGWLNDIRIVSGQAQLGINYPF